MGKQLEQLDLSEGSNRKLNGRLDLSSINNAAWHCTHPILLVVHDNLLEGIERACFLGSRAMNLTAANVSTWRADTRDGSMFISIDLPKGSLA